MHVPTFVHIPSSQPQPSKNPINYFFPTFFLVREVIWK